jgi:tellurite resistance protein TehA-like permease
VVGAASGVLNAVQQLGAAVGIAVLATIFFAYVDHGRVAADAMTNTTLLSIVPLALATLAVSASRITRGRREPISLASDRRAEVRPSREIAAHPRHRSGQR